MGAYAPTRRGSTQKVPLGSIPPSQLRRATSLFLKGGITGGPGLVLLSAAYHYPKGSPWNQGELSAKLTLIVDKPLVCQRICPTACLRTVSPTAAQCSGAAHCVCSRLQPLRGLQRPAVGAGMHFYPQFAIVDPHRTQSVLVALVAHWAYFGLFPPQAAASVRILNSQWSSCCA